jgi:hypothetical protein
MSGKPKVHFTPEEVPNTPMALLAKVRTVGGVANIVYAINQSRDPAHEPFVRFRSLDAWEKSRTGMNFHVGVYDLGKDVEDHSLYCSSITEARSFVLGILAQRRFRKHDFRS